MSVERETHIDYRGNPAVAAATLKWSHNIMLSTYHEHTVGSKRLPPFCAGHLQETDNSRRTNQDHVRWHSQAIGLVNTCRNGITGMGSENLLHKYRTGICGIGLTMWL